MRAIKNRAIDMGFLAELIKEKAKQEKRYTKERDRKYTFKDWVSLVENFLGFGIFDGTIEARFKALIQAGALAWSAFNNVGNHGENLFLSEVFCVSSCGRIWGYGQTRAEATSNWVKKANERWGEDSYTISIYKAKHAQVSNYLDFDEIFEEATQRVMQWHEHSEPDPIWSNKFKGTKDDLVQLIGEVVEGYCEAHGGEWTFPMVPDGLPIAEVRLEVETTSGAWTIHALPEE